MVRNLKFHFHRHITTLTFHVLQTPFLSPINLFLFLFTFLQFYYFNLFWTFSVGVSLRVHSLNQYTVLMCLVSIRADEGKKFAHLICFTVGCKFFPLIFLLLNFWGERHILSSLHLLHFPSFLPSLNLLERNSLKNVFL